MNKRTKIAIITIILMIICMCMARGNIYATDTSNNMIVNILNENKDKIGDIEGLSKIVDEVYAEVNSATTVDDSLKQKIKTSIEKINNLSAMDTELKTNLILYLNSQTDFLTTDNKDIYKSQIVTIQEWLDEQKTASNIPTIPTQQEPTEPNKDAEEPKEETPKNNTSTVQNVSNDTIKNTTKLPNTGRETQFLTVAIITIIAVFSAKKYFEYKEIK